MQGNIDRQGKCGVGEAVITSGGNLLAKYIIHTVGPVGKGGLMTKGLNSGIVFGIPFK